MKKREIAVLSIPRYSIGWVEFNATSLVKYWETGKTNHGLAVDVYDQNDVHLDAKNLFYLQDCEAGKSVVCSIIFSINIIIMKKNVI
jgi:hypothetical protein